MAQSAPQENRLADIADLRRAALDQGIQVFGEGDIFASLMLVGEAPGKEEAASGRPFVGPAGAVLNRLLDALDIPRECLWVTNLVKIRPTVETSHNNKANRPPRAGEIAAHRGILEAEIKIIRPKVILCLGAVPASALIHPGFRIAEEHGISFPGPNRSRIMATYHPAYLLRLRGPAYESVRDAMAADLLRAWSTSREG